MTLALLAALFSADADAARVVVTPVPVVVATPGVRISVGAPVLVAQPRPVVLAQPRPQKPCAAYGRLPPHKRPKRCR
jgi:hypothetical protein